MHVIEVRLGTLRPLQICVRDLKGEVLRRVYRESAAERIQPQRVKRPTVLIRLSAIKDAAFDLELAKVISGRQNTPSDVRSVLPVMPDGGVRIVHTGRPMHEHCRPESRFADDAAV